MSIFLRRWISQSRRVALSKVSLKPPINAFSSSVPKAIKFFNSGSRDFRVPPRANTWGYSHIKMTGVLVENFGKHPKKYQNHATWAWLPNISTPKRYQFKTTQELTLPPFFFSIECFLLSKIFVIIVITPVSATQAIP